MAFLSILRTTEERCEQCDATEHVLRFVVSQAEEDNIRLSACVICVVVAMDNAMEWKMSRQFAQALANRAAGDKVQEEAKRQKEEYDRRLAISAQRSHSGISASDRNAGHSSVLSDAADDAGRRKGVPSNVRSRDTASRGKGKGGTNRLPSR